MRFDTHSPFPALLLTLALAGCTQASTTPTLVASADVAAPPVATDMATAAAPRQAPAIARDEPACPPGSEPAADTSAEPGHLCYGALPTYFAQTVIWLTQRNASSEGKEPWPTQDVTFKVIPGLGRRMDLMVGRELGIRSFEGSDPATTVYLVADMCADPYAPGCRYGMGLKAYRVTGAGAPMDVTAQLLPEKPALSPAQRTHYDDLGGGPLWLDMSKLGLAPTMRWIMEFDPDRPIPSDDPRDAGGVAHFGFLVWNGQSFELKERVARSQWPCARVPDNKTACPYEFPQHDRFVINGR